MKRAVALGILALLATLTLRGLVRADGMMVPDEASWQRHRERSMINEPEQKAVVFFSRGKEQLIISPSYEGPASSFAWVVPVPARPKVEIVKGAIFHELAKLTMPRPVGRRLTKEAAPADAAAAPVTVLERKTVGAYDVSVLSATDGKALMKWLAANRYHLQAGAVKPIQSYVKERWTFVACRIKVPKSAQGLRTGTLAPLKLTFATEHAVYPMKLSAANPRAFSVMVYVLMPHVGRTAIPAAIPVVGLPGASEPARTRLAATVKQGQKQYPALAELCSAEMGVYVERCYPRPEQCTRDLTWPIVAIWPIK